MQLPAWRECGIGQAAHYNGACSRERSRSMDMRMTDSLRQQAYAQAAAFVNTLDRRDRLAL